MTLINPTLLLAEHKKNGQSPLNCQLEKNLNNFWDNVRIVMDTPRIDNRNQSALTSEERIRQLELDSYLACRGWTDSGSCNPEC